jgi:hypothetical protein
MTAGTPNQTVAAKIGIGAQDITREHSHEYGKHPTAREEFTAWLTASCQRQALPVIVTDHTTLAAVAALLR